MTDESQKTIAREDIEVGFLMLLSGVGIVVAMHVAGTSPAELFDALYGAIHAV